MRLSLPQIAVKKIEGHSSLHWAVCTADERSAPVSGQVQIGANTHPASTRAPRSRGSAARTEAFLPRCWRRVVSAWARLNDSMLGDLIGGVCLFVILIGGLWLAEVFRP